MKKLLLMGLAAVAAFAATTAEAMTLQEASAKVAEAAEKPATMADVMKSLAKEDQAKFLASVNEAIEQMPVPEADKVAMSVQANQAAIGAVAPENRADLIAEMFATASPEALAVLNETLSGSLFESAQPLTPEAKAQAAAQLMAAVEARSAKSDVADADKRNTAAVLMFVRADASLREPLLKDKPEAEKMSNWIDAAINLNNYKWLTGNSEPPVPPAVVSGAPSALSGALLADLTAPAGQAPFTDALLDPTQYALPDPTAEFGLTTIPRTTDPNKKWYNGYTRPAGYPGQYTGN